MSNLTILDARSKAIQERHSSIRNLNEWQNLRNNFFSTGASPIVIMGLVICTAFLPVLMYLTVPICFFLILKTKGVIKREFYSYPLYAPAHSKAKLDPLDINPATRKPRKPRAQVYLGFEPTTMRQAWLTFDVSKQHFWLQATTGGGKTETLAGLYANFLIYGSAGIFADGKADMALPAKICALSHRFMRGSDTYIINYITGNQSPWGKTKSQLSSTINPFLTGSVSSISELVKALLQDDGDIWSKRCASFVDALSRVLVYLRDKGEFQFNISHYAEFLQLEALGKLIGRADIPMSVKRELFTFVKTLPGLDANGLERIMRGESLDPKKSQQPLDQLGYVTMQLQPVINMLSGDYGYIFDTIYGSINIRDIVLKRRILLILIPALEKAAPSLRSLGQIVIALIRDLLASGIGNQTEGNIDLAIRRRFTNDISPYLGIYDEAGYYFVENAFAPIYAQSRSIGLVNILGSQDNYAMEKASEKAEKELKTVYSNSNTKIIGKIEDTGASMEQVIERVSEANFYEVKRMERNMSSIFADSFHQNELSVERKKVLEPEDFLTLNEGEVYVIHKDRQIRVDMFATFPAHLKNQAANVLVPPCELPQDRRADLIDDFRRVKSHLIRRSRKDLTDNLTPNKAEPEMKVFKEHLEKEPSFSGAFSALRQYQSESRRLIDEALNNHRKNESLQVTSEQLKPVTNEHPAINKEAEKFETAFDSDSPAPSNTATSVTLNDDPEIQSYMKELDNAFEAVFGSGESKSTIENTLADLNANESHRLGDADGIKASRMDAIKTVSKIDQALTDYPTPPPAEIDHVKLLDTLNRFKDLLDDD